MHIVNEKLNLVQLDVEVSMNKQIFIINQRELARAVGKTPEHLSAFKNRKVGFSENLITDLHRVTKISTYELIMSKPKKLDKLFKDFFKKQLTKKIISS